MSGSADLKGVLAARNQRDSCVGHLVGDVDLFIY